MNRYSIVLFFFILIYCNNSFSQENLPKNIRIDNIYGIDMITDEVSAIKLAEIVMYGRTTIKSLDKFKPFTVNSIAENKVWEIIIVTIGNNKYSRPKTYKIYINKNTAQILHFWDSH